MFSRFSVTTVVAFSLSSSLALAHGSIPEQAAHSVESAAKTFNSTQPVDVRKQFVSIAALWTAHETFQVTVGLKSGGILKYKCVENEDVEPVVWECQPF